MDKIVKLDKMGINPDDVSSVRIGNVVCGDSELRTEEVVIISMKNGKAFEFRKPYNNLDEVLDILNGAVKMEKTQGELRNEKE